MADPVAEKSAFLKMYMSNHPDTLVAYAKYYGKVEGHIVSAEMTDISTKRMILLCTLKSGEKQSTEVTFNPPLVGYEAVKPRLLEMKAIAQEKLGMIKAPKIDTFVFPRDAWVSLPLPFVLGWLLSSAGSESGGVGSWLVHWIGVGKVQWATGIFVVLHCLESLYTWSLCKKHTGPNVGTMYIVGTLMCGFPMWKDLRKRIQDARINSVMKVQ
ncbi:hypothetical protein AMATHDRAFT_65255 [Amanita thiersii Skay4041]|uniref:DUF2470 domain-containing protein n=1 Tax=Amanita thiersii Skay4041 TaxID=703135 RepID=A0A2A9NEQ5_9AGAR|nr:hypothetical protein AMATHDRAFT_65255 [Amanita thiersii Skay4041]